MRLESPPGGVAVASSPNLNRRSHRSNGWLAARARGGPGALTAEHLNRAGAAIHLASGADAGSSSGDSGSASGRSPDAKSGESARTFS
jgi:hypothetical protein